MLGEAKRKRREKVRATLARMEQVVKMRRQGMTYAAISKIIGRSPERCRQIYEEGAAE